MRIISGSLAGRRFEAPTGRRTHPMSEKARGAIFNMLGDITDLCVLDAFAGSGALAFEALSRGANHVQLIDNDKQAANTVNSNTEALGLKDRVSFAQMNTEAWSIQNASKRFNIIFCDPPYKDPQLPVVQKLSDHLAAEGVFILSLPPDTQPPELSGLTLVAQKHYGEARIYAYKKP